MPLTITRDQLAALKPCDLPRRLALFRGDMLSVPEALGRGAKISEVLWVVGRLGEKARCVQFAIRCARRVAHLNPDPRVQAALDAASAWLADPSEENRVKARIAADAANAAAANAADAAAAAAAAASASS